jgi:hypothetical protein
VRNTKGQCPTCKHGTPPTGHPARGCGLCANTIPTPGPCAVLHKDDSRTKAAVANSNPAPAPAKAAPKAKAAKVAAPKAAPKPKAAPLPAPLCGCGCGLATSGPKRRFRQGHDARVHGPNRAIQAADATDLAAARDLQRDNDLPQLEALQRQVALALALAKVQAV